MPSWRKSSGRICGQYSAHAGIRRGGLGFLTYVAAKCFPKARITGVDLFSHGSISGISMEKAGDNMKSLASFFAMGPGIAHGRDLGTVNMRRFAPTVAEILGMTLCWPVG